MSQVQMTKDYHNCSKLIGLRQVLCTMALKWSNCRNIFPEGRKWTYSYNGLHGLSATCGLQEWRSALKIQENEGPKRSKTFGPTFKVSRFPILQFLCLSSLQRNNYSTLPLVLLLVLVNISTSHQFFATSFISCQCLIGYSSKLLHWRLTASEATGLPTSVALPAQSLKIQAVLLCAPPSCLFHELEQLGSEGRASSSQLQLSGTHCRFTFAPRPSVAVSFKQGSRLIFSAWPFTDLSSENYWRDWTELNWTERKDFMF